VVLRFINNNNQIRSNRLPVPIFNAISGLGGAGSAPADASVVSFTNFCLYACFAFFGYTAGAFFNLLGAKSLMACGSITYVFYALMSYFANNPATRDWAQTVWIVSGAVLGWGAGWFWTAQGALMMAYAPTEKKGSYISLFWVIFNLGGFFGGILSFGLNFDNTEGTANPASYFTFTGIMAAGTVIAVLFLVNPNKVTREDGVQVVLPKQKGFMTEISDVMKVILDRNMLFLFVLFFASNFFYTYVFNGVNSKLFTIRTRGLNSALFWGAQMVGSVMFAKIVDSGSESRSLYNRARAGYWFVFIVVSISWGLGVYLQYGFRGGYDKHTNVELIDFASTTWIYPIITYIGYGFADSIIQTFSYWIMSAIGQSDTQLCARYAGYYKGVQSLGAAVAWLIDSEYILASYTVQLWTCIALFVVGMGLALVVVNQMSRTDDTVAAEYADEIECGSAKFDSQQLAYAVK